MPTINGAITRSRPWIPSMLSPSGQCSSTPLLNRRIGGLESAESDGVDRNMRNIPLSLVVGIVSMLLSAPAGAQGVFSGANLGAPTRLWSADDPLAGTNVLGQFLAGSTADSLTPVGRFDIHQNGDFFVGRVTVPNVPVGQRAYVQLVAWDSAFWGSSLANVPADQLGRTDIVRVFLTTGVFPDGAFNPHFTQPAIVPVPEPSVPGLGALGLGLLLVGSRWHARARRPAFRTSRWPPRA